MVDPTVLAKLTRLPTYKSSIDPAEKQAREATANAGGSSKAAAGTATTSMAVPSSAASHCEPARKIDSGN
ncbi:unnamed protein product [Gongylonema pulchrum]|uniref:Uncharacterized protein n=1 Tax=Gongylonema pulchrum TaxID=637853 RepID=A0A3P7PIM6_9BILA|nr:unnamed protein product [Gongylonema pulchrum]